MCQYTSVALRLIHLDLKEGPSVSLSEQVLSAYQFTHEKTIKCACTKRAKNLAVFK